MSEVTKETRRPGSPSSLENEIIRRGDAAVARHGFGASEYLDWDSVYSDHLKTLRRLECASGD